MPNNLILGLIAALSAAALGGGLLAANLELQPYLNGGSTPIERTMRLDPQASALGLSYDSAKAVLGDCVTSLRLTRSLEARFLGETGLEQLRRTCLSIATHATDAMPMSSYAWFARAQASVALGLEEDFNSNLVKSQLTGPAEQWLAELRVSLAEDNFEKLDPTALTAHERDLRLLVLSSVGLRSLARRYIADAGFRGRIAEIVESMPENSQRRFVNNLQLALQNR